MGERKRICLNCGDNRAEENSVVCENCTTHMWLGGGYRSDGL